MSPTPSGDYRPGPAALRLLDGLLEASIVLSWTRIGYALRRPFWRALPADLGHLTVLITGANSGLGLATCHQLAARGAQVIMVARNAQRGQHALGEVQAVSPAPDRVRLLLADLSQPDAVDALADEVTRIAPRLDALIHNAGVLLDQRKVNTQGHEMTLAVNVLGPLRLTRRLHALLRRSAPSRVILVSSGGLYAQAVDLDNLQSTREPYQGAAAYARTKRMQVMLAEHWQSAWAAEGISAHAMHPGWALTPGLSGSLPGFTRLMRALLRTPDQGADTITWLACAPGLESLGGRFWLDRRPRPAHIGYGPGHDATDRARLIAALHDLDEA